jgi:hypothetical protein
VVSGDIGRTYLVEFSSDLTGWNMLTNFVSTSAATTVLDPFRPGTTRRFYRAISP